MAIDLNVILPNISKTLNGTGFLFGSGTSCEAGYPMMAELTRDVMGALGVGEQAILDDVVTAAGLSYDPISASPNIEQLSDLVIAHWTNTGDPRVGALETRIRSLIVGRIDAVTGPNLDHHYHFFEALKRRAFGLPCSIWIFTTNYDLLFEMAAARCGVPLENGFCGATERFFNPALFGSANGTVTGGRFTPSSNLTVKLVKLHGSISWTEESSKFYEQHPAAMTPTARRVMVLPRRKKVIDTLTPPYDQLFALATRVIGSECKYLVSCGFSFSDEHINQNILMPIMQSNRCKLFALSQTETTGMAAFKTMPNFQAGFESELLIGGNPVAGGTGLWKFSEFVGIF